jgi:maltooligosyltrehalose trehalohydrolase
MHFIDTAHGLGLAVILDVVYNHFGPVGNFISEFAPTFLGAAGEWGDLINYDREGSDLVRQFMIANVEQWIGSYRFDGLRFDATQAIHDSSPEHIVSTLCATARRAAGTRRVFLVGESEPQDMRLLKISGAYADGLDAIWSEDWHHSAFVALTGRRDAYFTDYRGDAPEFASMARHGTLYQGQWYTWQTAPRGGYGLGLPSSSFVDFLENHDQVANTGLGGRLWHYTSPGAWRAMTGLLLLGPAVPLLFQGQEFGSSRPFTYFADHSDSPELAEAVRAGRLQFLAQFPAMATPEMQERIPAPHDPATFDACRLLDKERTADSPLRRLHRDLLALRRDDPVVARLGTEAVRVESSAPAPRILLLRYLGPDSHRLLIVNLGDDHLSAMNDPLLAPRAGCTWRVQWSSDEAAYGGPGRIAFVGAGRWLFRAGSAVLLTDAH